VRALSLKPFRAPQRGANTLGGKGPYDRIPTRTALSHISGMSTGMVAFAIVDMLGKA